MSESRKIIHVDMDAFYASVEQRDHPELRGKPVIAAGAVSRGGWSSPRSYEVRKFGVRSAMPATRAKRLCPEAIFVKPEFTRYKEVSRQIREIFLRHTPLVEPLSLDEAYLDVTEELTGIPTATETARKIRAEILDETRLTASAGVAPNKFLAKIASDWKKPNGMFVVKPHQIDAFLQPLPVARIPGVGRATEKIMTEMGIATVGDLREWDRAKLMHRFGKWGERLWELARGIDDHPVVPDRIAKQISSETTFSRDLPLDEVRKQLVGQAEDVWASVSKRERIGKTVTVKLRSSDFVTQTRQMTPTRTPASLEDLLEHGQSLLGQFAFEPDTLYRLVGIGLSNFLDLEDRDPIQSRLFD